VRWLAALPLVAACSGGGGGEANPPSGPPATLTWVASLAATPVAAQSVGATTTSSSTRLQLTWGAPSNFTPTTYEVTVTEVSGGAARIATVTSTSHALTELKSATAYRIDVRACHASCYAQPTATVTAETPAEVWHLQGSGNGIAGHARPVADGNVRIHAMRIGEGAPAELAGHLRLYYGPFGSVSRGFAVAVTTMPASAASPSSYLTFTSRAGASGLIDPPTPAPLVRAVATGQGVALASSQGARVRLFFEGWGNDGRTRILYLDSQDGYSGLDFNAGASGVCATTADYAPGGGCAPSVAIGVEGDAVAGWPRIANARQFKIGVPTATDWRWDSAAGTFMVFTLDRVEGCSSATHNQAYAVWSGAAWQVQYDAAGCPRMMASMQAAHPLHLGGVRYKLYYGDPSITTGRVAGSQLPFLGPKKLVYADGATSGAAAQVDFDDWEAPARGRELRFLWPDGSTLNDTAEGYIDDFTVLAPTSAIALQVMYLAITDGNVAPLAASAVLVNP
jgi:hypothetical protein